MQDRAAILFKIADRMEQNLELLATAETWDNGKPIRETSAADVPLAIDHFRYFASCIRAQEGGYRASEIYVWRGQTPFVMSIAATRQRSSHRRPRHCAP